MPESPFQERIMPSNAPQLAIIGAGNMGGAIVRGALNRSVLSPNDLLVIDVSRERRGQFSELGCLVSDQPRDALTSEQIILAVKPQSFPDLARTLGMLGRATVVISIMAGMSSTNIRSALGENARVVRVMPNIPCQVGAGMSAIALGDGAHDGDETLARSLLEAIGKVIMVDEAHMHAVTAVSGSGPAYIFLLAEAMEQGGMQLGLSHGDARTLAIQTVLGAAMLLDQSDKTADELRQAVSSPGGTTAAAIEVMFERELPQIIIEAMAAARERGRELDEDAK
jgi:pyrroline-5-carboxylate reductase